MTFTLGFFGVLAAWSGVFVPRDANDFGNTILFSMLENGNGGRPVAITVVVTVLAVMLSTSACDSWQNGMAGNIAGVFFKNKPLIWVRVLLLAVTAPCIVVSLRGVNILQLYLVASLVAIASAAPTVLGLWHSPRVLMVVTPFSMLTGCANAILSLFWWSAVDQHADETYAQALHRIWTVDYQYQPFLITLSMSFGGVGVGFALEWVFRKACKWPYDLTNPFTRDIMPVETKPDDGKLSEQNDNDTDLKGVN